MRSIDCLSNPRATLLWIGAALLAGCGGGESANTGSPGEPSVRGVSDTEIVVGSHTDLSGPVAIWGVGTINAARMLFDEVNEAGGVHGRTIRFVVEDTSYQVPRAIQAANKLINRDKIFAMLLPTGTPTTNAVMTKQIEAGVPNLFPVSGARSMVDPAHPLKFTQRGIYYDEVRAAVRYFLDQGKQVPCVIYQDTDYGQEILDGARDQAAAMGASIAQTSAHKPTETEFTAAILRLRNAGCDLVLMGTVHRDTVLVLDAARKAGWDDVAWVGNNAAYGQVVADNESGEGYYAFVHIAKFYPDSEMSDAMRQWWQRYEARYGEEPGIAAMEGQRGAALFIKALEIAGRDLTVESLIAALESITQYEDMFGYQVSFGPDDHKGVSASTLSQVRDGRWETLAESISF
ncbi:MAG: ABC transporter substrate-binding protein [Pseudomonadaceae bacterium]|nr:ABC transporter substrate-binding protein [Pseudomonadaceae bacterium]